MFQNISQHQFFSKGSDGRVVEDDKKPVGIQISTDPLSHFYGKNGRRGRVLPNIPKDQVFAKALDWVVVEYVKKPVNIQVVTGHSNPGVCNL